MVFGKKHGKIGEHVMDPVTQEGLSWKYVRYALRSWCCWCSLKIEKQFLLHEKPAKQVVPF